MRERKWNASGAEGGLPPFEPTTEAAGRVNLEGPKCTVGNLKSTTEIMKGTEFLGQVDATSGI